MKLGTRQLELTYALAHAFGHPWATRVSLSEARQLTLAELGWLVPDTGSASPGYHRPLLDADGAVCFKNRLMTWRVGDQGASVQVQFTRDQGQYQGTLLMGGTGPDGTWAQVTTVPAWRELVRPVHVRLMAKLLRAVDAEADVDTLLREAHVLAQANEEQAHEDKLRTTLRGIDELLELQVSPEHQRQSLELVVAEARQRLERL